MAVKLDRRGDHEQQRREQHYESGREDAVLEGLEDEVPPGQRPFENGEHRHAGQGQEAPHRQRPADIVGAELDVDRQDLEPLDDALDVAAVLPRDRDDHLVDRMRAHIVHEVVDRAEMGVALDEADLHLVVEHADDAVLLLAEAGEMAQELAAQRPGADHRDIEAQPSGVAPAVDLHQQQDARENEFRRS